MPDTKAAAPRRSAHARRAHRAHVTKSCCRARRADRHPAIALVILLTYDWNKARPWLNAKTSEAIGRPFAIAGDLSLTGKSRPAAWPTATAPGATAFPGRT
jgi:hypothetical protein